MSFNPQQIQTYLPLHETLSHSQFVGTVYGESSHQTIYSSGIDQNYDLDQIKIKV